MIDRERVTKMGQFVEHTAVAACQGTHWQAEVHRGWRIGSVANGGYVLALVGRALSEACLLYTSPSPRDATLSRMPSSA